MVSCRILLTCLHIVPLVGLAQLCLPLARHQASGLNDCFDIRRSMGNVSSGFYDVLRPGCATLHGPSCTKRVYCDMTTDGGGWTVIQQRQDGSVDFFVSWNEYKLGFGSDREFWAGNEYVYALTNRTSKTYELLVEGDDDTGNHLVSRYTGFRLGPEATSYQLQYDSYTGISTTDNLSPSRNQRFGTHDTDTDSLPSVTCGSYWRSGWWFEPTCLETGNLNLPYAPLTPNQPQLRGIRWRTDGTNDRRLVRTQMKVRPTGTAR